MRNVLVGSTFEALRVEVDEDPKEGSDDRFESVVISTSAGSILITADPDWDEVLWRFTDSEHKKTSTPYPTVWKTLEVRDLAGATVVDIAVAENNFTCLDGLLFLLGPDPDLSGFVWPMGLWIVAVASSLAIDTMKFG